MATEVIYARVPAPLKAAADAYASQHGKTLAGAVADLMERGLGAVSDERSVRELQVNLAYAKAEKARVEADLVAAQTQLATLGNLAHQADRRVGTCPHCGKSVTGRDLLEVRECPHCHQTLSDLILPAQSTSSLDQRELLMLVGALGAVFAVAYLASKKG
jgi:hypothetical protein